MKLTFKILELEALNTSIDSLETNFEFADEEYIAEHEPVVDHLKNLQAKMQKAYDKKLRIKLLKKALMK